MASGITRSRLEGKCPKSVKVIYGQILRRVRHDLTARNFAARVNSSYLLRKYGSSAESVGV